MSQAQCVLPKCVSSGAHTLRLNWILLLICFGVTYSAEAEISRAFTVRDSIEFTTFSDPPARSPHAIAQQSPDGRYLVVVTTRGELATNRLISTLWIFDTRSLKEFVKRDYGDIPRPHLLWMAGAVPHAQQFDSYGSILTKVQWSSDARSLLFLEEDSQGHRRLFRMGLSASTPTRISAAGENVVDFAEHHGVVAYVAESPVVTVPPMHNGPASISMKGVSLLNALDPTQFPVRGSFFKKHDLWVVRGTQRLRVNPSTGSAPWYYPVAAANFLRLSISPQGHGIVIALAAPHIATAWRKYRSLLKSFDFKALAESEPNNSEDWGWPWQYAYVDLEKKTTAPLFDAPSAWGAGYGDPNLAVWSEDGNRVVVTNTFLPESSRLISPNKPCAAAVYDVVQRKTTCLTPTRFPEIPSHLLKVAFSSPTEANLVWTTSGNRTRERYRLTAASWERMETTPLREEQTDGMRLFVHQSLNEPPTLWVADERSGRQRLLMDPNPAIHAMDLGEASVFRWKDRSGYEWKAGLVKPPHYKEGVLYPLVVQTHGFQEKEFLLDGSYTTGMAAQALAVAEFLVLQMEDRRDRHSGLEEAADFADGCADGIEALAQTGIVDRSRVGIVGFSRTSWYVETALERYPDLFHAASIIDGIDQGYVTYSLFCASLISCKLDHEAANGGPPYGKNLASWMGRAASFNVDKIQAPLRIEAIQWYSLLEEWELYSSLLLQNKAVELFYIPDGQHILQQPLQRYASQQGSIDWFRYWLQQAPGASPQAIEKEVTRP